MVGERAGSATDAGLERLPGAASGPANGLAIPRAVAEAMLAHARAELPNEACGILGGTLDGRGAGVAETFHPARNAEASPLRYSVHDDDLRRIVTRIRRDSVRASDVIRRLRALLARHEPERRPFDVGVAMEEVATLMSAEARRRGVTVVFREGARHFRVLGDQTQIQQVLIDLVRVVAAHPLGERGRRVVVEEGTKLGVDIGLHVA